MSQPRTLGLFKRHQFTADRVEFVHDLANTAKTSATAIPSSRNAWAPPLLREPGPRPSARVKLVFK